MGNDNVNNNVAVDPIDEELWRLPKVLEKVGMSRSEWYRRMVRGDAPKPIFTGGNWTVWLRSDVARYINGIKESGISA